MPEPKITLAEVEHVARLARLDLSPEEKERMRSQLDAILTYIDKLRELDTTDAELTSHAIPRAGGREAGWEMMTNVMRDDEICPSFPREEMLANAPEREDNFFRVPKIIEE
jgi:aspartyl-tRNA(Asn)/glutamyl-tRNA(Gln) amidotransferase subunit C